MNILRLDLEGEVCAGLGEGRRFTQLDWAQEEFGRQLGFLPHPGTFNLRMAGATWEQARRLLVRYPGIAIVGAADACGAKCFPVTIGGRVSGGRVSGALVLPLVPAYPTDKLEIVAPVALRQTLGLNNCDRVRLRVDIPRRPASTKE